VYVLTETLQTAHPVIPFVTEEIYGYIPGAEGLLAGRTAPPTAGATDAEAEATIERLITAVQALRNWRDSAEVKASAILPGRLEADGYDGAAPHLARLARIEFPLGSSPAGEEPATTVAIPGGAVAIMPSPDLDLGAAERKREAKRAQLGVDIERTEGKLANAGFVAKAPAEVVQAERDKLAQLKAELEAL